MRQGKTSITAIGTAIVLASFTAYATVHARTVEMTIDNISAGPFHKKKAEQAAQAEKKRRAAEQAKETEARKAEQQRQAELKRQAEQKNKAQAKAKPAQTEPRTSNEPLVISLSTGFQKVIGLPSVPARVAIGDPEVASVTVLKPTGRGGAGAGVLLTGLKTGSTSLLVWDRGAAKPRSITVSVTSKAAEAISNLGDLQLLNDGQVQTLSGSASDIGTYQQAKESLMRSSGGNTADLIDQATIETSGTVQVDVKVVEFTRSELQTLGINLGRSIGSDNNFSYSITGPAGTTSSSFSTGTDINGNAISTTGSVANAFALAMGGISGDITLALDILQSNGYARILAEPSLIAQSGKEASFLAGGEIPIPVPGSNGAISIEFKKFGVGLSFKPTILSDRTIALNVAPEVSDLDFSRGTSIQGVLVPAILTRRASTTVELGEGQSFVIGGLISRNIIANAGKVPWLADVPIIGALFKSRSYSREDKELVITVTPRFVKPRAKEAPSLPIPGRNIGANPSNVWGQLFLPNRNEPVPGFTQ